MPLNHLQAPQRGIPGTRPLAMDMGDHQNASMHKTALLSSEDNDHDNDNDNDSGNNSCSSSPKLNDTQTSLVQQFQMSGVPLHTSWTLYVDKIPAPGSSLEEYEDSLRKIYTVDTIEGFWQVFNNIPCPSQLYTRYSYHLMRDTRKPVWEDPGNENGGHWKMKCAKTNTNIIWTEIVLAAIGEQFKDNVARDDGVVGVSVSIRDKEDHFQIWNETWTSHKDSTVVDKVRELLPMVKFHGVFYKEHKSHQNFEGEGGFKSNNHGGRRKGRRGDRR